jgi:hypothetical protein
MTDTNQSDLIPVRALNQVSYCPRLYYLEYVDSVMPINEFVADGLFQHRRVNQRTLLMRSLRSLPRAPADGAETEPPDPAPLPRAPATSRPRAIWPICSFVSRALRTQASC